MRKIVRSITLVLSINCFSSTSSVVASDGDLAFNHKCRREYQRRKDGE